MTVLPIVIRAADVVLRLVPGSLTEASYALGSGAVAHGAGTCCCRPRGPGW